MGPPKILYHVAPLSKTIESSKIRLNVAEKLIEERNALLKPCVKKMVTFE